MFRLERRALAQIVLRTAFLAMTCLILAAWPAQAQSVASARINGIVTDSTGGALPGVTVTLTSPALQVASMVAVAESDGAYRFVDLPAGTYRITYALQGFNTVVREGVQLTVGFVATINMKMTVGGLNESVTVSGQGPVVDVTSTSASVAFTKQTLQSTPRGADLQDVFEMAPGVTTAVPDVGGSNMAQREDISSYGVKAQPKIQVEGMDVTMGADYNTAIYFNDNSLEEVQVKTAGTDASVSTPGISVVAVLKSGGNDFHGVYAGSLENGRLQSSNLDAALQAQGLNATSALKNFYNVSGDLGGRLIRDKLWFYGAYSRQARTSNPLGFVSGPGPDGQYLTGDEPLADFVATLSQFSAKVSYQASKGNKLIYAWQEGVKAQPANGGGRFVPLDSTRDYKNPTSIQKIELQSAVNSQLLIDAVGGYAGYLTDYNAARSFATADAPSRQDLETNLRTGSHPFHQKKTRNRYQMEGTLSWFPRKQFGGSHEIKTGIAAHLNNSSNGYFDNVQGNYILYTDNINGVPGTPSQIRIYNTPVEPKDNERTYAWYIQDAWRPSTSVTINLGTRWERQHSWLPAQSREPARDFPTLYPSATYPEIQVQTWSRFVPRLGFAWDLSGDGKSVIKATVGAYNYLLGDTFADAYNANATANILFQWHDLNGDKLYEPGEVNLDPNGTDFISATGATTSVINPNLKEPTTWEATLGAEHELAPNVSVDARYVYRRLTSYFDSTVEGTGPGPNVLRPYDVYDIPITRRDPGPNGVLDTADDGGSVTLFDYDAAYRGAAFVQNELTNSPNADHYNAFQGTVTKRFSGRWSAQVSYYVVKNHRWLTKTFNSPNDYLFPVDDTWGWGGTVTASYLLPAGVTVSGFVQSRSGQPGQRTYTFRTVDPDGGTPIAQLNNVTLPVEAYGSERLPSVNIVNLRASKEFSLMRGVKFSVDFAVFNLLNTNAALDANFASGPTFGFVTDIIAPRIASVGGKLSF